MMKFLVVVLALAAVCLAEPEADAGYYYRNHYNPGHYYNYYGHRSFYGYHPRSYYHHLYKRDADAEPQFLATPASTLPLLPYAAPFNTPYAAPFPYNAYNPYVVPQVATVAAPVHVAAAPTVVRTSPAIVPAPIAPIAPVAPLVARAHPHLCVTEGGCAALALRAHGLAKREATAEADADADADPEAYYYNGYYNNRFYNPYSYGYNFPYANAYNGFYNAYPYNAYPYNTYPYASYPYAAAPVAVPAPVAAPAPVAVPAPVVAPLPVRPAVAKPIIQTVEKPVTYTHVGAHPLRTPATVIERKSAVVGHALF